ncbi:MAG: diacylglycerol kinase family lipid kinase [Gammaproteobacteria bacterium]|nr:diacylglycerol kinase family lipid kinase [Gammaproteobacteria bacterium]MDE1887512.1 diacylglycerol kinase family lipid kinase [Gammaproteobacteria bacterium]MDE2024557.1 diacylglycerol kinase family lipid kinase [Gammaproteobacteria bacterium]MDE2140584.1 diacylglycerol kinase family lipid kinase [Gammaproteobacteria bacterium]
MHAALVINPAAGRGAGRRLATAIADYLAELGVHIHAQDFSHSGDDLALQVHGRLAAAPDAVIVVGGDGSVHEAVNGWMQAGGGAPLAFVPVGTGNDFTKMLGYASDWRAACRHIAQARTRTVDVARCNDFYFVNNLGIGFDARVAMTANRMQWLHSQIVYGVAMIKTLALSHDTPTVRLWHDDETMETAITLIAVNNGRVEGGAFMLAPQAQIDDGLLDVVVAGGLSRLGILRLVPQVLRGSHIDHPAVTMFRTGQLVIESDTGLPVHADGEIRYTDARRLEIEILPHRLTLMA